MKNSFDAKSVENSEKVEVYIKSDLKKTLKMKLNKKIKLDKVK